MRSIAEFGLILALATCGFVATASAVPINYGNFVGIEVIYEDVTEDALTAGDSAPLFGSPTIGGDTLDFNPIGFSASASGIAGVDNTDGELTMFVQAKPNKIVENIQFSEAGEFDLAAAFGFESNNAFASVTATLFIDILEVDGAPVTPISDVFSMTFTDAGDWLLSSDGSGIPLQAVGIWSGAIDIDLTQMLIDASVNFTDGATRVGVTLDNRLTALSAEGTSAFIAKKDFKGLSVTAVIPEPTTGLLLSLGLAALSYTRRRA